MNRILVPVALALVAVACGGDSGSADSVASTSTSTVGTEAPATTPAPETTAATTAATTVATTVATTEATTTTTTTTQAAEPALTQDGDTWTIVWESIANPFWSPADESGADPLYFIHTKPDQDGFYFALEMYTTGYGALWTGELGDVAVRCMEGLPGPNSTGICPYFDPDGTGPIEGNSAFVATGSITIHQLDADGYDITVNEIVYPNGTVVAGFRLTGP